MAHVLVIDDESVLLGLIATTLQRDGYTVTPMVDALAAIDSFVTSQLPVDLLLVDVTMQPISGFEIVKRLVKAGFAGPVLFMSGYTSLSGAITESMGVSAMIEKPFTAPELRTAVKKALAKSMVKKPNVA